MTTWFENLDITGLRGFDSNGSDLKNLENSLHAKNRAATGRPELHGPEHAADTREHSFLVGRGLDPLHAPVAAAGASDRRSSPGGPEAGHLVLALVQSDPR